MQQLLTNFMVVGLEEFDFKNLSVCTIACLKGKKHHEKFSKEGGTRATNVLSLKSYNVQYDYKISHIWSHKFKKFFNELDLDCLLLKALVVVKLGI